MDFFGSGKTSFLLVGPLDSKLNARLEKIQAKIHLMTFMFTDTDLVNRIAASGSTRLTILLCKATSVELQALTWKLLACTSDRILCSQCKKNSVKRRVKDPSMKARSKYFSQLIRLKNAISAVLTNLVVR